MIKTVYVCDTCGTEYAEEVRLEYVQPPILERRPPGWAILASGGRSFQVMCASCRKKAQKKWEEAHAGKT